LVIQIKEIFVNNNNLPAQPLSVLARFQPVRELTPQDLPEFRDDGGNQLFRRRRIDELQQEIADLNRELDSQEVVDAIVERTLQISFEEGSNE
jgi:hypothetical protein